MNKLIQHTADKIIEEIDEYIDNTIHWQLDGEDTESAIDFYMTEDLTELELKIKQQVLFTLIKRVTK